MIASGRGAAEIVAAQGLAQVSDVSALQGWVDSTLQGHPDEVARFRGGEQKLMGFLVGQVMKRSGGKANPKEVADLVRSRLQG
jgi:Asp-tRNA(Asn)/Glu-tRNA(Gln) amidotransferase B subunit